MSEEDTGFFGAPPSGDAPIVLGPPSDDPFGAGGGSGDYADFSTPMDFAGGGGNNDFTGGNDDFTSTGGGYVTVDDPTYLGGDGNEAPILLGGGSMETDGEPTDEQPPVEPTGTTPMQIWNDQWQETLKVRKDEENERKAELIEQAKIAMEQFHADREQRREGGMGKNREDEQAKLEAIEADLENDNSWQRVCKMIELSQDNAAESQDVKRMRDIMIFLKNDTAKATALSS